MPLRLEIKKKLTARSDRVKSVDLHEAEPWVLVALYSGNVMIWNYESQQMLKSFEATDLPARCAKFVERKQWVVAASDDNMMRVYNYNTMDKVTQIEAHPDYIRYVEVHPIKPYILTTSDDNQVKMWDWDKNFQCIMTFEGHSNYVMMAKFNPKDTNTFATASLDKTIKIWGLTSPHPHFSLEGHERGVNCVDYYPGGDKPYLISGADDRLVKIWDYQTKACVQTLDGHTHNINCVAFHPRLPIILSSSEDGTVRIWHSTTYRAETTLNYGMERSWSISTQKHHNKVALGYDEGTIVIRLGKEMPVVSMDQTGKAVWALNNDIKTTSVRGVAGEMSIPDGERLPIVPKDLGSCELYPQSLKHNSNGRFVVVCGDGEYIIYTSQALRNKSFGSALDFVWSATGTGDYAVRESISRIKIFKNFKETKADKPKLCTAEGLFGGHLVGVRGSDCVVFYDWDDFRLIRKIDVLPRNVFWNEAGDLVVLACDECFYVLKYSREATADAFATGKASAEEGVDGSFDLLHEISEKVRTGYWVGDCFLYTNSNSRLNYYVGGEVMTVCHLPHTMYMLGYLAKENKVFLVDKSLNMFAYSINMQVLQYQTAVVRKDFATANAILQELPKDQMDSIARFLEGQGFKEEALAVSTDPDQKFDLAVQLNRLDIAHTIMEKEIGDADTTDVQHKWKQLGDLALSQCNMGLAEECARKSNDLSGLLLLYTCNGNLDGIIQLALTAKKLEKYNVAFLCLFLAGRIEDCIQLLIETDRIPEAAFFARTYLPSQISRVVGLWKQNLGKISTRAAASLAEPKINPDKFPDLELAIQAEALAKRFHGGSLPASAYLQVKPALYSNLLDEVKKQGGGLNVPAPEADDISRSPSFEEDEQNARAAQAQRDAHDRAKLEAEQKAAHERAQREREAAEQTRAESAKKEAEQRARKEAEDKARREAEERAKKDAEEKARRAAEENAKKEAAAEKAKREAEEKARLEAQEKSRREAEEKARREAEEKARREAEEMARREAEEKARREAEEKAKREAEMRAKKEAEENARREAEEKARKEAEEKAKREAEERARREAEEKARREAEERARRETDEKARREAEEKARKEAEEKARKEIEDKARREAEERARQEALQLQAASSASAVFSSPAAFGTPSSVANPPAIPTAATGSLIDDPFLDEETQKLAAELNDDELDFGDDDADWGEM